ncbi:MAG: hypothetical protein Q9213_005476, partial [Squamulea squamosa]
MSHWHAISCEKDPITLTGRDAAPHALQDGRHVLALPIFGASNIRCITGDEAVRRLFDRNKNLPKEAFTLENIINGLVRTMKAHKTESRPAVPLKSNISYFPSRSRPEAKAAVDKSAVQHEDSDAAAKPDLASQPPNADKDAGFLFLPPPADALNPHVADKDSKPKLGISIRVVRPYLTQQTQASMPSTIASKSACPPAPETTTEPLTSTAAFVSEPKSTVAASNSNSQEEASSPKTALSPNTQEEITPPAEPTIAPQNSAETEAPVSHLHAATREDIKAAKEAMMEIRDELLTEMKAMKEEVRALRNGNAADTRADMDNVPGARRTTLLFRGLRALRGSELDL